MTRDGFDLLVHYLPDYDYASHALGPDAAHEALGRADAAIAALFEAAGRARRVPRALRRRPLLRPRPDADREHRPARGAGCARRRLEPRRDALRRRSAPARARARRRALRRRGALPRGRRGGRPPGRRRGSRRSSTTTPTGGPGPRARSAIRTPARCSSRRPTGWEFVDLAGRHHLGGGSHGSLATADSEVPMLTVGLGEPPASITAIKGSAARPLRRGGRSGRLIALELAAVLDRTPARPARDRRRARARGDGARPARALRPRGASRRRPTTTARFRCGYGQTISQPYIVALTCEALELEGDERVLDVGTGSGYAAAVLAELAAEVHTIERIPELAETARASARRRRVRARPRPRRRRRSSGSPSSRRTTRSPSPRPRPDVPSAALGAASRGWPDRAAAADGSALPAALRARAHARRARGSWPRFRPASFRSFATNANEYPVMPLLASIRVAVLEHRVRENRTVQALLRPANWIQVAKFGIVGASGYLVNLGVYSLLLKGAGCTTSPRRASPSSSPRAGTTGGTATGRSGPSAATSATRACASSWSPGSSTPRTSEC